MNCSRNLNLEKLENTRDLGGIVTKDGRTIRKGRVFRSGALSHASSNDRKCLESLKLARVFDFRTPKEQKEKPDCELKDTLFISLSILENPLSGVSRELSTDKKTIFKNFKAWLLNPNGARDLMKVNYKTFVDSPFTRSQYHLFFVELLDSLKEGGNVLWHCTSGKDRVGFGTAMLLEILGVDRASIMEDFLESNRYLNTEYRKIKRMFPWIVRILLPKDYRDSFDRVARELSRVFEEYLESSYEEMEKLYGSVEAFLSEGLGITEEMKEEYRTLLLE